MTKTSLDTSFFLVATALLFHITNSYVFNSGLSNFDVVTLFGYLENHSGINPTSALVLDFFVTATVTLLYFFVRDKLPSHNSK